MGKCTICGYGRILDGDRAGGTDAAWSIFRHYCCMCFRMYDRLCDTGGTCCDPRGRSSVFYKGDSAGIYRDAGSDRFGRTNDRAEHRNDSLEQPSGAADCIVSCYRCN